MSGTTGPGEPEASPAVAVSDIDVGRQRDQRDRSRLVHVGKRGTVELHSEPGTGTTLTVRLPVAPVAATLSRLGL